MEKNRKLSWTVAFLSTLSAVGLHGYLTSKFYALRFGALGEASACNFSDLWNCDAVSASTYSQLFGVPMAVWGLSTNLIFAIVLLFSRLGWFEDDEKGQRYSYWLAIIIAAASVVMGTISLTKVNSLCLFCVITYVASALSLAGTYFWAQPEFLKNFTTDLKALFKTHHLTLGSFAAIPAMAFLLNGVFVDKYKMSQIGIFSEEKVIQWQQLPAQNFAPEKGLIRYKGTDKPTMEIVEFADFRCPHCKMAYYSIDAFTDAHPDVKLIFKFFPLDGTCNASMGEGRGDGISCEAAFVTHCAEKLAQKGWEAHHYLFENQDKLRMISKREEVREITSKGVGLDLAALTACTENPETKSEIQAMAAEGVKAGIQGTPAIFVNGRLLSGGQMIPVLEKVYQKLQSN